MSGLALCLAIAAVVVWIAWWDAVTLRIEDGPLVVLAVLAVLSRGLDPIMGVDPALSTAAIFVDAALAGGGVWLVREAFFRRRGYDGIGFGDVKLAAVGGMLCGFTGFAYALFLASLAGLAVAGFARWRSNGLMPKKLPFGMLLGPALWSVWVWVS